MNDIRDIILADALQTAIESEKKIIWLKRIVILLCVTVVILTGYIMV